MNYQNRPVRSGRKLLLMLKDSNRSVQSLVKQCPLYITLDVFNARVLGTLDILVTGAY